MTGGEGPRFVVVGAGAIGGTVAAQLHLAGVPVIVVARGAHLEALRRNGLRYLRPDGEHVLRIEVAGGPDEVDLAEGDVLALATKSQDTEGVVAAWAWKPVTLRDGSTAPAAQAIPLLTLQNGMENERAALRRFGTVLGATVILPADHLSPGEIVASGAPAPGIIWLGRSPRGAHPAAEPVAEALRAAGFLAEVVPDASRYKAAKLLTNLGNVLDALYPPGPVRERAAAALDAEARTVLAACGIDVADPWAETSLDVSRFGVVPVPGRERGGGSTWQSLVRGTEPETDFLNGEIVLLARSMGVEAPLNTALQRRIRDAIAAGAQARSLPDEDLTALLDAAPPRVLVTAAELLDALGGANPPTVLDVRWALGDDRGREHYLAAHVPTAVFVDLDRELAGPPSPAAGRHPLPDVADLQAAARRWGVRSRRPVVVYDDSGGLAAARAWWLLRWAGLRDVRILDGALRAWRDAGFEPASGDEPVAPGDVELTPGHLPVLDADGAAALARDGVLLDARAAERYRGEVEPVDPRAGHVPGAVSAPTTANLDAAGRFRPPAELRERFAGLGATPGRPVGVYCGSGVTAAHEVAALAVAGLDAALFPGSWSQWSSDPARPVATGDRPEA